MNLKLYTFLFFLLFGIAQAFAQADTPLTDKYEYKELKFDRSFSSILNKTEYSDPQKYIVQPFNETIVQWGREGWEFNMTTWPNLVSVSNSFGGSHSLSFSVVGRRKIYDAGNEIEKRVATYTAQAAERLKQELILEINKVVWAQIGADAREKIVNDLVEKIPLILSQIPAPK